MDKSDDLTELQKKHQKQMKEKRDAIKQRKARTHRLIIRGAIAEKMIPNAEDMTNEQFQEALYQAVSRGPSAGFPRKCPSEESVGRPCGAALGRAHASRLLGVMYKCALLEEGKWLPGVIGCHYRL